MASPTNTHLVVGAEGVQQLDRGDALVEAAAVVAPDPLVEAVVEVVEFEMLELAARGREQLLDQRDVIVHRAADVEEHQHLDRVVPLRPHLQVEPAGIARGAADRGVEVELVGGALAREAAQLAQSQLEVAGAELDIVVEVAELRAGPRP